MKKKKNKLTKFFDYILDVNFTFGALAGAGAIFILYFLFSSIARIIFAFDPYKNISFIIVYIVIFIWVYKVIDSNIFKYGYTTGSLLFFLAYLINLIFIF